MPEDDFIVFCDKKFLKKTFSMSFKDKVVWITGASSGIGEALAEEFVQLGAQLILSSRRKAELERVKTKLKMSDDDCLVLPLDLEQYHEMEDKVDKAMNHFGRIDYLVNNGGISQRSLIIDTKMDVYKRLMDIDYLGTVALSKAVLPVFIRQKSGHYSVVTSLMGKFASPLRSGYCGAKHALHGFFDALRLEHEDDNIGVTLVCPGFIRTNISHNALTGTGAAQQTMDNAQENGMSPNECAQRIIRAIDRGNYEAYIGGKERMAVYLKRWFPRLLHRVVRKSAVT